MSGATVQSLVNRFQIQRPSGTEEVGIYSEEGFRILSSLWTRSGWQRKLSYEPTWLGIPIIQLPEDILMMQELIYKVRPDVVVETGTAHGGTAVLYASVLELLGKGHVVSIDIEIRKYNRLAIEAHPMSKRITLIEGSSTDDSVVAQVRQLIHPQDAVLVALDSNHTHAHVSEELEKYSHLVTAGSYIVVFDGVMEVLTDAPSGSPSWATDSPGAAMRDFLAEHEEFEADLYYNRLEVTYCPSGFLRRKAE
jgi:cephalosporin hydroxylase